MKLDGRGGGNGVSSLTSLILGGGCMHVGTKTTLVEVVVEEKAFEKTPSIFPVPVPVPVDKGINYSPTTYSLHSLNSPHSHMCYIF